MKRDGHIHTPFCPHGTADPFEEYIEKAIECGFTEISFTEHAPLPTNFNDPTPDKDSGMDPMLLKPYFEKLDKLKSTYENKIKINIGLEIDYIIGFETETRAFLDIVGPLLDDAILSVHFLKWENEYCCIDFSEEVFFDFAKKVGSVGEVYNLYYEAVTSSINANLGRYKPRRIGHPTLVHKFQLAHNEEIDDTNKIIELLDHMKTNGYELDLNSAGLSKKNCQEPYPPLSMIEYARKIELPMVFGSDAHSVKDLHQHFETIIKS